MAQAMSPEERKAYLKKPIEVVITRSCKTKANEEAKLTDYEVGQELTITHLFGDELISLGKAVVKGSPEHKVWVESQKKKKSTKSDEVPTTNELLAEISEGLKKLVEVLTKK